MAIGLAVGVLSLASSAYKIYGSRSAKRKAKREKKRARTLIHIQTQQAVEAEKATTAENIRRSEQELSRVSSLTQAKAAASGASGVSSELYMAALEESGRKEIDWLETSSAARIEALHWEGYSTYKGISSQYSAQIDALDTSMWSSIFEAAGGAASAYGAAQTPGTTPTGGATSPSISSAWGGAESMNVTGLLSSYGIGSAWAQ